ncbi:M1 family metallopeptidase [Microbacteriaceae bacterium]|nr:M1 family metallopeptidase [Candidatus Saccharibacteria bacterium]
MQQVKRLYEQFQPKHYDITWSLASVKKTRNVGGTVRIDGNQLHAGKLLLHAKNLDIHSVSVDGQKASYTQDADELAITHSSKGEISVVIDFTVMVTDAMHGIYPCYYQENAVKQELYATQFESHHAREAFPCVDEPEAKATFDVHLITPKGLIALSNMPAKSTTTVPAGIRHSYERTPKMSSYLLAFAVGDFQKASEKTSSGVDVNVYATKVHPANSLDFALHHAVKTIEFFDDYFNTPYPLPKSDHIALPDFSSGAMENWGLITYREIALLADPKTIGISGKQYIAEVVAHELSHQWFGNLVTMKWWNNLWLNESFATIMEYLAVDAVYPEWNEWFHFSTNEGVIALRRDAIDGVQPVQLDVHHPDEISSLFDGAIVYAKGGRLLRKMQRYVGDEAFRAGLEAYFREFAYSNTTGDDLWKAIAKASNKDVASLMNTWISQSGYPIIHATLQDTTVTLSQERFFSGPHAKDTQLWPIPLWANTDTAPELMDTRTISFDYADSAALHLNSDDSGHYIVNYDTGLKERILAELQNGKLSDVQRAQFLHEQTLLARAGRISSASLVELLAFYNNESNERVWDIMALALADLRRFVETDKQAEKNLRRLSAELARPQFERLGWNKKQHESEDDTKLRAAIIGCMLYGEDQPVIQEAIRRFHTSPLELHDPELRSLIIATAVRHDTDTSIVESLLNQYRIATSVDVKSDITSGITATRHKKDIHKLIKCLKDSNTIRNQDVLRWFVALLSNRDARELTWEWLTNEWSWIEETFASDKSQDYFPRYSASILNTRQYLEEYTSFFTPYRDQPALTRAIDMGILDLQGRIDLVERDSAAVAVALAKL